MSGNSNLHDSSRNKQDGFYTNLQLVEDELKHYRAHFKGKRVLCNCDDPYESNFFKYFAMSFNSLGLKSLTATCYASSPVVYTQLDLFGEDGGRGRPPSREGACPHAPRRPGTAALPKYDPASLEKRIAQLLRDDEDVGDITNQRGIYEYLLSGDERHLSIRRFSDKMARTAYERQGGTCVKCGKHFAIEEMQADHITPWAKGGKTVAENCQMLCVDCNRRKSDV